MRLDDLSILAEAISAEAAILYANKRRALRGQPPLTKEEEAQYRPSAPRASDDNKAYLSCYKFAGMDVSWRGYTGPEMYIQDGLCKEPTKALAVYRLVKLGYRKIYVNKNFVSDINIKDEPDYDVVPKAWIEDYVEEAEGYLKRERQY